MAEPELEQMVRAMIGAAGLKPSEEEIAQFIQMYPSLRAGTDKLYADIVRYEQPALVYRA